MQKRTFGRLGEVSVLTLGGGGTGQVWGRTTREECVATVREAVESGITLLDVAPSYGNGESEVVIGEAFGGKLPDGVRVLTKCRVGNPPALEVYPLLERSLDRSLSLMNLERVDLFLLYNQVISDADAERYEGTPRGLFVEAVRPAMERLVSSGRIGDWGITGVGEPDAVIETLQDDPRPAAVQAIANLLDSPGALRRFEGPARPREIIDAAQRHDVGVMGIRAVQAGALTDGFDRELAEDNLDNLDFPCAATFRDLAREIGESPASLAHRYSLSMAGVATVVLGVKNREELRECVAAEAKGLLDAALMARINAAVNL